MTTFAMRRFLLLLTVTMGLGLMAPAPVSAKDEEVTEEILKRLNRTTF